MQHSSPASEILQGGQAAVCQEGQLHGRKRLANSDLPQGSRGITQGLQRENSGQEFEF